MIVQYKIEQRSFQRSLESVILRYGDQEGLERKCKDNHKFFQAVRKHVEKYRKLFLFSYKITDEDFNHAINYVIIDILLDNIDRKKLAKAERLHFQCKCETVYTQNMVFKSYKRIIAKLFPSRL